MNKIKISEAKLIKVLTNDGWNKEEILAVVIAIKECKDNIEVVK